MKTVRVWLYKKSKTLFWKLIRLKQSMFYSKKYSKYSHTEIIFKGWLSFSSSEQDWWVRFKRIDFESDKWDFVDIRVSDKNYFKILSFAKSQVWDWYNYIWILFAQILNFNLKWKEDWFCSEICSRVLEEAGLLPWLNSLFTCPAKLAQELDKYYTIKHK